MYINPVVVPVYKFVWLSVEGSRNKIITIYVLWSVIISTRPSECGRQHTLISLHAQTAGWQPSNGNFKARMSE